MKPSELRIGNLAIIEGNELIVDGRIICDMWIGQFKSTDIKGVKLTEQRIFNFGFKKKHDVWYAIESFSIINTFDAFSFKTCMWTNDKLKHVHQLQNLYFALTNTELKHQ